MSTARHGASSKRIRDSVLLVPATSYSAPTEMPQEWRDVTTDSLRRAAGVLETYQRRLDQ